MTKSFVSEKVARFSESVIREMSREAVKYQAVNLAQGFPDFPAPEEIKQAAQQAIAKDINQYAITWGSRHLRAAIARQMQLGKVSPLIRKRKLQSAVDPPKR